MNFQRLGSCYDYILCFLEAVFNSRAVCDSKFSSLIIHYHHNGAYKQALVGSKSDKYKSAFKINSHYYLYFYYFTIFIANELKVYTFIHSNLSATELLLLCMCHIFFLCKFMCHVYFICARPFIKLCNTNIDFLFFIKSNTRFHPKNKKSMTRSSNDIYVHFFNNIN